MQFLIYKTTNLVNGRFYIGMHQTANELDGYMGSGRRLKAEINKYGKVNFTVEILERHLTRATMILREVELVTHEMRLDPLCLNLKNGGEGGQTSEVSKAAWTDERRKKHAIRMREQWQDVAYREKTSASSSAAMKQKHAEGKIRYNTFTGKKHSEATKQAIGRANAKK